jgi:hypothetical protein
MSQLIEGAAEFLNFTNVKLNPRKCEIYKDNEKGKRCDNSAKYIISREKKGHIGIND